MKRLANLPTAVLLFILLMAITFPFVPLSQYYTHVMIIIFIWGAVTTAWTYMARFGMISLCHGAWMGIPAYTSVLLFNFYHLSPWVGMWLGLLAIAVAAGVVGYACFRFGLTGHYFAVTTLVITELVALVIIAFRDVTGGRLGLTVHPLGTAPLYFQFESKVPFYFMALALLLLSLYIWRKIDQSKVQKALAAIGEDEVAASSIGINVVRYKTGVAVISALVAGMGGIVYGQYIMYLNPVTLVSIAPSLVIVFMGILGGMLTLWGPMIGAIIMTGLQEYIRVSYGTVLMGWAWVGYGFIIVVIILFLPKGLYGTLIEGLHKRRMSKAARVSATP